ncbi:MAG: hypothetical protein IKL16_00450 [Clostridia bacterium]|nr:hypothetical protein [Clostridia bacterium]
MAKKVLSIALALLMIFNVFAVAVSAASDQATVTLAVDDKNPQPGDTVNVTVSLATTYKVFALQMMVAYDSTYYEVVGDATGLLSGNGAKFTSVVDSASLVNAAEGVNGYDAKFDLLRIGYTWLPSEGATDAVAFDNETAIASFKLKVKADAPTDGKGVIKVDPAFIPAGATPSFDSRIATYVGKGTTTIADSVVNGKLYGNPINVDDAIFAGCVDHEAGEPVQENVVPAQPGKDGSYDEVIYCKHCGFEMSREQKIIEASDHTPGEPVRENEVAATCTATGSYDEVVYCTCCTPKVEISRVEKTIDMLPHTEVEIPAVDATCTETGLTAGKECSVCGTVTVAQTATPVVAHTPGEAKEENRVEASATVPGSYDEVVYCSVCNEELSRVNKEIPALGHTAGAAVREKIIAATCASEGSYDEVVYCTCCTPKVELSREQKTIDKLPHTEVTIPGKAATCTETGLTEGIECDVCYELIKAQEVIPTAPHTNDAVVTDPTCTDKGYTTYTCSVCGNVEEADYVDALGHTEVEIPAVDATCTETGLTAGKECTVCGETTVEQEVVDALGHTEGEAQEEDRVEPDCVTAGSYNAVVYCEVCGEKLSSTPTEIPALGHTPGEAKEENRVEATEGADGSYDLVVYCTVCNAEVSRETIIVPSYSKAEANITTVISKNSVKADDIVTVTVKLSTNFYVSNFQIPVIFDKTQFEVVGKTTNKNYLTFSDMFAERNYTFGGRADQQKGIDATSNPDFWNTDEAKAKYGVARMTASYSVAIGMDNETYAKPQDDVVATFQLKALTDVEDTTKSIFVSEEWAKTADNTQGDLTVGMVTTEDYYDEDKINITYTNVSYKAETIAIAGVTVSGTVKSSGEGDTTIEFYAEGSEEAAYTVVVAGSGAQEYSVDEVVAGTYTVVVSKDNHKTATYTVVVGDSDVEANFEIIKVVTVSGTVKSFDDGVENSDDVTISFYAEGSDEVAYTATVTGSDVQEYSVDEVVAGTYTVVVSKANHATRTYTVVVGDADIEQELVIHLMGDITGDGKVNAIDTARANAHAKGTKALVDYELNCSDISGDGKVNAIDTARINAHAKGTKALWS